jgi:hypothetical protein
MTHWAEFLPGFKTSNLHERSKAIVNLVRSSKFHEDISKKCHDRALAYEIRLEEELSDRYNPAEIATARKLAAESFRDDPNKVLISAQAE